MINVLIAIDDFSPETGESHIVPISHLWDPPIDQGHADITADMRPGSTIVLHRLEKSKRRLHLLSRMRSIVFYVLFAIVAEGPFIRRCGKRT